MTPFAFDTLSASKRLREAGMAEGVAEAVVAVFQHATATVDFSLLATKADLLGLATKADIADMATKADIADMATKADIADMATKTDLEMLHAAIKSDFAVQASEVKLELSQLELRVQKRSDQQMWGVIGLLSGVIMLATAAIKLFP